MTKIIAVVAALALAVLMTGEWHPAAATNCTSQRIGQFVYTNCY